MTAGASVLLVVPELPYPPDWGFATRVYQLAKNVAVRNRVDLLFPAPVGTDSEVESLRRVVDEVHVVPVTLRRPAERRARQIRSIPSRRSFHVSNVLRPGMQLAVDRLLARRSYDIVQLESSRLCGLTLPEEIPLVIDEHNVESELLRRMSDGERSRGRQVFNALEYAKYVRFEDHCWSRARACVATSRRDAQTISRRVPHTVTEVVPNGVDLDYFGVADATADPNSIVFTGLLTYRPNLEAASVLVHQILPRILRSRPDTVLTLVGGGHAADLAGLTGRNVVVTGWVPDVRPFVQHAAAVVVPLRIGGGTRLKVLEALAMGKPVVSTPLGCEGIDVTDGEHLRLAESNDEIADVVLQLLADPQQGAGLGRAGRDLVASTYSWQQAARALENCYHRVVASAGQPRRPAWLEAERG